MTKGHITVSLAGGLAALVIALIPAGVAFAHDAADDETTTTTSTTEDTTSNHQSHGSDSTVRTIEAKTEDAKHTAGDGSAKTTAAETKHQEVSKRLDNAKKKVCENRQNNVNNIMDRRVSWAQRHIDLFTTISERTQKFYTEKGKTLENYDDLVAAANNAKTTAQANLDTLKSAASFDCNSDDPKGEVSSYKTAFDTEMASLKAYRSAVKNLIVAVKSVQGDN